MTVISLTDLPANASTGGCRCRTSNSPAKGVFEQVTMLMDTLTVLLECDGKGCERTLKTEPEIKNGQLTGEWWEPTGTWVHQFGDWCPTCWPAAEKRMEAWGRGEPQVLAVLR